MTRATPLCRSQATQNNCAVSREDASPSRLEPDSRADTYQRDFSRACDYEGEEDNDDGTATCRTPRETLGCGGDTTGLSPVGYRVKHECGGDTTGLSPVGYGVKHQGYGWTF